ncbi:hypothetical protein BDN72DRAFT_965347 [Pluteus cervinus]|uniref:Uncharacterized protein n=1 Tax=Pluteus cervinus TaxID=181527 RepID=A0ACD3A6V7_9AGAR|nr:hypothetical protein BDN72DRAFT_965347 [Pluteus cervinus]
MSPDSMGNTLPPPTSTPSRKGQTTTGPICNDTPLKHSSHTVEAGHEDVNKLRGFLGQELDCDPWHNGGTNFLTSAFKSVTTTDMIEEFLDQSKTYDAHQKRWHSIPPRPRREEELYKPLLEVMDEILSFSSFDVKNRKIISCDSTQITHHNDGEKVLATSPDFVILGHSGNAFKEQNFPNPPTYAQQCFIEQHNRVKVYSALVTESTIQLLQFDRGGVVYSEKCDFHNSPTTFVRLVLGLASDDEEAGFDTSIYWENGERWLRTLDAQGHSVLYRIIGDEPVFFRRTVAGRGTLCWVVSDPLTGQEYFIKESWRSEERESEIEFLELVKALPGVGQMIAHEEDETKTIASIRGLDDAGETFTNRIWCRVTLENYGGSLDEFSDGLQLLEAFRDILAGILGLWGVGVVHRDITLDNLRFGKKNATIGWRGILIDFDMAIRITRRESLVSTNSRTGTRAFQSINVLQSYVDGNKNKIKGRQVRNMERLMRKFDSYPHDFRDDMESLFYALCWVCLRRNEDGDVWGFLPGFLADWDSSDAEAAARSKREFLNCPLPDLPRCLQKGSAFEFLLESLQEQFRAIVFKKGRGRKVDSENETLEATYPEAEFEMKVFLDLVDEAICRWKNPQEACVQQSESIVASGSATALDSPQDSRDQPTVPPSDEEDDDDDLATFGQQPLAVPGSARLSGGHKRSRSWSGSEGSNDENDRLLDHSVPSNQPPISGLFSAGDLFDSNGDEEDSPLHSRLPNGKRLRRD